jgi:hypothetical protein
MYASVNKCFAQKAGHWRESHGRGLWWTIHPHLGSALGSGLLVGPAYQPAPDHLVLCFWLRIDTQSSVRKGSKISTLALRGVHLVSETLQEGSKCPRVYGCPVWLSSLKSEPDVTCSPQLGLEGVICGTLLVRGG